MSYSAYLTNITSLYTNPIEPSGGDAGNDYMRVGNYPNGDACFILLKLPSDLPSGHVETAVLRLAEYNSSYYSSTALTVKCSPVTGAWDAATKFNALPAYNSDVVNSMVFNWAAPSSSNYDYRTGYHSAQYRHRFNNLDSTNWTYVTTSSTSRPPAPAGFPVYMGYTLISPAYYGTYVKYRNFDIKDVIQSCVDNEYNSILIYFDLPGANDSRKFFKSTNSGSTNYYPKLDITAGEKTLPVKVYVDGWKQAESMKVYNDGWKQVEDVKVYNDGWKG